MSFRFTNDLITTFKQKALMSHYVTNFIFPRTFVGYCAGVTAKLNSSAQLLELKVDEEARANFLEKDPAKEAAANKKTEADNIAAAALSDSPIPTSASSTSATVDSQTLAKAIEMAIWDATRKIKAAKEEYYHLSVKNARLLSASKELTGEAPEATEAELATIRDFSKYGLSTDAALIAPHAWDSIRDRSPFHVMLNSPHYNLTNANGSAKVGDESNGADAAASSSSSTVVSPSAAREFAPTRPLTLGDIMPELRASFLSYPAGAVNSTITDASAGKAIAGAAASSPLPAALASSPLFTAAPAQRKQSAQMAAIADRNLANKEIRQLRAAAAREEAADELTFWTRVEAIRKGQQAVIGASLSKRPYKDQAGAVPVSNFEEKIALKFVQ